MPIGALLDRDMAMQESRTCDAHRRIVGSRHGDAGDGERCLALGAQVLRFATVLATAYFDALSALDCEGGHTRYLA